MKKLYLFLLSLTFFSFLIFLFGSYFFVDYEKQLNAEIENTYIEPSLTKNEYILDKKSLIEEENENDKIKVVLRSAYNIKYYYFPANFKSAITDYISVFKLFLNSEWISNKIDDLNIEFYKERTDVRGKMKNHSIKLFWVEQMGLSECSAVWIHEFWHFIDLYFFKKDIFIDESEYFYEISWDKVKVMKAGLTSEDFVSGYSMTNKYEDFAETFTYFILHNEDFIVMAEKSSILKAKYDFFNKYLFIDKKFVWTDFSLDNEVEWYYRDITKIDFSLENFLEFLKK